MVILFVLSFNVILQAQKSHKYAIESGYIKLELTGDTKGTKEIWWDDYGRKTCEFEKSTTTTKMFGISNTQKKDMLTILIKDQYWTVDYLTKEATKGKVPFYSDAQEMTENMTDKEKEEFAEQILKQFGGEKQAKETLKGYECDVISVMGAKTWIYKGVGLKMEAKVLGITSNAMFKEFKPDANVPSSKFEAPKDYKYTDLTAKMKEMWGDD